MPPIVRKHVFPIHRGRQGHVEEVSRQGLGTPTESGDEPKPGDIVVWWREQLAGWKGHVGLVHQLPDGMLYTI